MNTSDPDTAYPQRMGFDNDRFRCASTHGDRRCQLYTGHLESRPAGARQAVYYPRDHASARSGDKHPLRWNEAGESWLEPDNQFHDFTAERMAWCSLGHD